MISEFHRLFRKGFCLLLTGRLRLHKRENMTSNSAQAAGKRMEPDDKEDHESVTKKAKFSEEKVLQQPTDSPQPFVRVKTKKMAILVCYSGKEYYGLQRNSDVPTIEEDVLKAMHLAGAITKEQYEVPQILGFQRAARTDKGVSALKQVLSMKLPPETTSREMISTINTHLPSQIRVIAVKKATQGFNCKNHCDGRTYTYMTPSFAFAPLEALVSEDYRITASQIHDLNSFLALYKGSHNFHNFTSGRKAEDPSNNRYVLHFECGDPFLSEGLEFVRLRVRGQSFMMHQIRKMVALAIAKMRGFASEETLKKAWSKDKVDLPKAPGVGLMLEDVHYDGYNKRYGGDGIHEPLIWDEHSEELKSFVEKHIYPTIVETEKNEKSMLKWMETLMLNSYDTFDPEKNHRNHPEHFKVQVQAQQPIQEFPEDLSLLSSKNAQQKEQKPNKEQPTSV